MTVDELAEALARVGVDRRGVVTWDGAAVVRRGRRQPRLDGPALRARLVDRLRLVLYERLYCGVPDDDDELGAGLGHGADAWFVGRLSAAGTGVGGWQPGWHGVAVGPGGVTVRRHGLSVLARPGEVRRVDGGDAPLAPGMELALRFGPELPRALPGFWLTLGDAPVPDDEPLVRFYWHVAADAAPTLVRELTGRLNVARTPFQLKVVDHPGRYRRRDAAVLYVPAGAAVSAVAAVMAAHRRLGPATRPGVPAFTLPLARGLAVAEDTGEAASFGTHRCGLVAEAVVRVHERGSTAVRARLDAVGEVLAERGIDAARPWQRVLDLEHVRAAATAAGSARTVHLGPVHGPDAPAAPVAHGDGRAHGAGRRSGNGRDALDVAAGIGAAVCERAVWHREACTWVSRTEEGTAAGSWASLDADLYRGTAGVAWFLAELAAATGSDRAARTAVGAALHALDRSGRGGAAPDDGLFTGAVGVAVAAEHVAGLLGRADVRDRARALVLGRLDAGASAPGEAGGGFDLVSGAAGTVVGLLLLHRAWGERALLDAATRLGDALLEAGSTSPAGLSWASPGIASSAHLTGLSHGASGPAWALAELAAATGLPGPRGAALDAVRYETACRDPVTGAWPDFRTGRPSGRRDGPPPTLWCHGAAGIGLARARITSLLHDETCAREAEEATALVRAEVRRGLARPDAGWSLCHGLAGTADALLTASTGSASVGSASVRFASVGSASAAPATSVGDAELLAAVGRAGRDRAAAWTAPDHPVGLMTGAAGVGLLHLRLARPSTASVLLLTSA